MGWIRHANGQLRYAGRITPEPFRAWCETREGAAAIGAQAARMRFSLFGRRRAARRWIWRELAAGARDPAFTIAIQTEIDAYLALRTELAYGEALPRLAVDLRRLAVVPRALLNAMAYRGMTGRLASLPALASLSGGDGVRAFFLEQLVQEIDRAVASARPSPRHPIGALDGWASVGLNATFVWAIPLAGPAWPGHHYVFEVPARRMTRGMRKAVDAAIRTLEGSLPSLSRRERDDILRRASAVGR